MVAFRFFEHKLPKHRDTMTLIIHGFHGENRFENL